VDHRLSWAASRNKAVLLRNLRPNPKNSTCGLANYHSANQTTNGSPSAIKWPILFRSSLRQKAHRQTAHTQRR